MGYCKFGEWCLFKHEDITRREINVAMEKMDTKIVMFENNLQLLKKCVSEKDTNFFFLILF